MTRMLTMIAALVFATLAVSSACIASQSAEVRFTLEPAHSADHVRVGFRKVDDRRHTNNWSTELPVATLTGLDVARFRSPGSAPIRFAIVREAGRLDCDGKGGDRLAIGTCRFSPDERFAEFLASHGIGPPTNDEAFSLMALDVRSSLVNVLAAARYPTPSVQELIELTAVGVTPGYIAGLARAGYRPASLQNLVEFGALKITPEFIGGFERIGYHGLSAEQLVQLRALNITPQFALGFDRVGYARLPVDELVQLKALNVTPEYVQQLRTEGFHLRSPAQAAAIRAVDRRHQ